MGIAITELTPVEQTALVTQYARALDSRWPRPILGDTLADEIVAKIDYDFQALGVPSSAVRQTALRAKMLDERVRGFISEHPDAVVVALGAGLDTGMLRVKPPATVDWYNVDLPNVIALRNELVPGDDHAHSVAASGCEEASLAHAEVDLYPAGVRVSTRLMGMTKAGASTARVLRYRFWGDTTRDRRGGDDGGNADHRRKRVGRHV